MLAPIFLAILSPVLVWLMYWYYRRQFYEKYLNKIPGPTPLPLLGSALDMDSATTIVPKLMEYYNRYKTNFKVYLGSQAFLFITEPKEVEFFLTSSKMLKKSGSYNFLRNWLGTGLLTSTGQKWRKHRKVITPAFHFQILEEFVAVFDTQSEILLSKLHEELATKESFDIYPFITRCTLDIICETAMGTSVNAQNDYDSEYVRCVTILLNILTRRSFSPTLRNDLIYMFTDTYRQEKRALKVVHDYTRSVIANRKKEFFSNSEIQQETTDSFGRKKKRAFLDLLLDYSQRDPEFTEEDMREEVDTFMFEGHDTTATSITFALYALSKNPNIQEKAYEEIRNIFDDDPKRHATYKDLQEMKYLEMVIKESLRFYVTIPMIGREVEEDTEYNGITLPKGLNVELCIFATHHSTNTYKDPETFDPERFSVENIKERHPFAYVPFSAGPRNCIGQKFAMLEMKSTISKILRNFELLPAVPDHKVILRSDAVLKSDNGVYVKLKRRQN